MSPPYRQVTCYMFSLLLFYASPAHALLPYLDSETAVTLERGKSKLEVNLRTDRWTSHLSTVALRGEMTSGLLNNLDFSVEAPYLFRNETGARDEDGLGDLTLKAKVRFIKGREANPVSIAGQLEVKFPSCDRHKGLSPDCTGEPDLGIRAIASKEFFPMIVHLNLGYVFIGNPSGINLKDILTYSLAFDYMTVADHLRVVGELAGESNRYPKTNASPLSQTTSANPLSLLVGLLYDVNESVSLSLAGNVGLTRASPDYGMSAGVRYFF